MQASLRQAFIRKLAHVKSADQAACIKAEDHIAGLLNDDQMLTMENTDQSIKKYETYASRAIDTNTRALLAGTSNDDNSEIVAMRAELAELRALKATTTPAATTGAAHTGKRARVHKTRMAKLPCPRPTSRAPSARRMDTTPRVAGSTSRISSRKQPR
jgi:hypothetical protein